MKLNENFSECLLGLKECIFTHKQTYEGYGSRNELRFYSAMFQVEREDFDFPFEYCRSTKRKVSEELQEVLDYKDLYLTTDFLNEDQADSFLKNQFENSRRSVFGKYLNYSNAIDYYNFVEVELSFNCMKPRRRSVAQFVKSKWGKDYNTFVEINRGVEYLADYWRAIRFAELTSSTASNLEKGFINSSTDNDCVNTVNQYLPLEEED